MAGTDWAVLGAGLGGTVLGSALQWAQAAVQARRERRREQQSWSREDRRLWAEKRQQIYLDTIAIARRQLMSLEDDLGHPQLLGRELPAVAPKPQGEWKRAPEVLDDWKQRLAEVEFYGSDEVRSAIAKLDVTFEMLERYPPGTEATMMVAYADSLYAECVSLMRHDLGLSDGGRVDLGESRTEVMLHVLDLFEPSEADDPFKDLPEPGDPLKDLPG